MFTFYNSMHSWNLKENEFPERSLFDFCFRIKSSFPKHERKSLWKMKEIRVTRKIPTDNSKVSESKCKFQILVLKWSFISSGGPTLQKESFFSKIKGHMGNVPLFTKWLKDYKMRKNTSHGEELPLSTKSRSNNENPPLIMGTPLPFIAKIRVRVTYSLK